MDVPVTVENIPFAWGAAFLLDITIGIAMFCMVIRKNSPHWALAPAWWIGWWSWASAFTLIINVTVGTSNPFAYHQIGVLTESMTNIGMMWWVTSMCVKNWFVTSRDWEKIELLRSELNYTNQVKLIHRQYENDPK